MSKNKTIIVEDYFGTKELTRSKYIERFQEHSLWLLRDYDDLDNTTKMYDDICSRIDALANCKFDLLYERQQEK